MYRLRELERKDISAINKWRSNRKLIDYLGAPFRFINNEIDDKWFDNYLANRHSNIRCTIVDDDNNILGLVSLTEIDRLNQSATFHIMIGDSNSRGKGIGSFATYDMLKHAFYDMNLNRIELTVLDSNYRAIKMYEKIGFKQEGIKKQAIYKNGTFVDMIIMAILKKDFTHEVSL